MLLLPELADLFQQLVVLGRLPGSRLFQLAAFGRQQVDFPAVTFVDECEVGKLAAVIEDLEIDGLVLVGELLESAFCFFEFLAVPSDVIGNPGAGVLEVATAFFLASDFEPHLVESLFTGGSLFAELLLVVLDGGGLGGEFLLAVGGSLLFLLGGVEFLSAGALRFFDTLEFGDEGVVLIVGGFEFAVSIPRVGFQFGHTVGDFLSS